MARSAMAALIAAAATSVQLSLALLQREDGHRPRHRHRRSHAMSVEEESLFATPASKEAQEESLCAVDPRGVDTSKGWQLLQLQNFTPFGTVFPKSWAPTCPCAPVTNETEDLVKFNAFRKCGTKLAIRGGQCIGAWLRRRGQNHSVSVRAACGHGCRDPENMPPLKEVWWTRAPADWLISSYLYQRRGDEPLKCYMNELKKNFNAIASSRPGQPPPIPDDLLYNHYLSRVSEEDGLFMEMYRTAHHNQVSNINQVVVAALEGMKNENRFKVCLEDFMRSPESYEETWESILRFITGKATQKLGDKKLKMCLSRQNVVKEHASHASRFTQVSTIASSHATTVGVMQSDLARMRSVILQMDDLYFDGIFGRAAEAIGCEAMSARAPTHSNDRLEQLLVD